MLSNGVSPEPLDLELSRHAIRMMAERNIPEEWVQITVVAPALRIPDPNDPEVERFFGGYRNLATGCFGWR